MSTTINEINIDKVELSKGALKKAALAAGLAYATKKGYDAYKKKKKRQSFGQKKSTFKEDLAHVVRGVAEAPGEIIGAL